MSLNIASMLPDWLSPTTRFHLSLGRISLCRVLPLLGCLVLFATPTTMLAQPPLVTGEGSAAEASENEDSTADGKPVDPLAGLVGLKRLQRIMDFDAESRWRMLATVSPRGIDKAERKEMVDILIKQLRHSYPDIRVQAANTLSLFGPDAAPAIPALMEGIGDIEQTVTQEMVWVQFSKTLAAIGPAEVLDPLMKELPRTLTPETVKEDGKYKLRWGQPYRYLGVAGAIAEMGEGAKSTAPTFIDILRNGPRGLRWSSMFTLSKLGDAALPAIPEYIANLDDKDFNIKVIACRALAELGPASKAAVPKLLELMEKPNLLSTRTHAAMCLGAIGPTEGVDLVQQFTDLISEPNAFSQERGLTALGRLGRHAENARSFVEEQLANGDFSQRPEAARTLWQITGTSERTLEILEELIDNPTYDLRVFDVLREMGPDAAAMSDHIAARLSGDDQSMLQDMIEILDRMGQAESHRAQILATLPTAAPDTTLLIDRVLGESK